MDVDEPPVVLSPLPTAAGGRCPLRPSEHLELLWRDACLAEAKLLLEVTPTGEEVGDAVLGVGKPLGKWAAKSNRGEMIALVEFAGESRAHIGGAREF